jgi:hypothetical protein
MTEREHARAGTLSTPITRDNELAPGRASRSSSMDAPSNPMVSGLIARKAERDSNGVGDGADQAIATASSSIGMSLPTPIMRKFESSLGTDLSSVRVHTGAESASAASAVGAKAYTMGQDIHFGAGHYDPSSGAGEHLLAHEVAHTVQQRGGTPTRQNKLEVSSPHDAAEHEADRAADAMVSGSMAVIASAPVGTARLVQRDAEPAASAPAAKPWFDGKMSFDLGEIRGPKRSFRYVTLSSSLKAKGSVELVGADGTTAPVTAGPKVSKGGVGGNGDIAFAQQHFAPKLANMQFDGKAKETISFELGSEQVKIAAGLQARVDWQELEFLKGAADLSFIFAGAKWKDIEKDPNNVKVMAADVAIGASGEGLGTIWTGQQAKTALTVQVVGAAVPNWANVGVEVAKDVAKEGATTAGTDATTSVTVGTATADGAATAAAGATDTAAADAGVAALDTAITIDTTAVAASAAAVILPLGAAALMVAGATQTGKNIDASAAAAAYGTELRAEAKAYASSYAATIGGSGKTANRGALDANVVVMQYMAASGKNRAESCADLLAKNGPTLADQILSKMRDKLYDQGCAAFEAQYANEFGLLEKLGPTWGMRGVFRGEFRMILYADS